MKLQSALIGAVLVCLLAIPGIWELLKPGYYSSHDGEGHIIRLSEFDIALRDGQIPPRMSKNLMWGYGYYFFNFNYPLVYWAGEAAHLVGFNFTDSIKIVSILGLVLSGLAMFAWQRSHWGNWGGLLAAVFYMYAPYRLLNIYVRGSVAEHLAFIMLPLLFMSTEKIVEGDPKKRLVYISLGGISYGLLMLSHNIMAFIFTLVLGLFMAFHILVYRRWKLILGFAAVATLGLLLSAYFWVPSLMEKQYVRLDQTIGQDFPAHFVYPLQLLEIFWGFGGSGPGPSDGMSFQIGPFHLLALVFVLLVLKKLWAAQKRKAWHILFYLGIFLTSVFFMLEISRPLWDRLPLLKFTQFPWRFLSWTVFATSVLAGAGVYFLQNFTSVSQRRAGPTLVLVVAGFLILTSYFYYQPNERIAVKLPGDRPIAGSTTWADEQATKWFTLQPTSPPKEKVESMDNKVQIQIDSWKTGEHNYRLQTTDLPRRQAGYSQIVEHTMYYPGWKVRVDGQETAVDYQNTLYPGQIVFNFPAGTHQITSRFTETPLRLTSDIISLLGVVIIGILLGFSVKRHEIKI